MKKFLLFLLLLSTSALWAQETPLPCGFSQAERDYILTNYGQRGDSWAQAWQRYLECRRALTARQLSTPPANLAAAPAEFEPAEGVCLGWKGYTDLLKAMIKEITQQDKVFLAGTSSDYVLQELRDYGCNMANVVLVGTSLNSVWMRDYGPHVVYNQEGGREIIDLQYNRPRPQDDQFPSNLANYFHWPSHQCKLILPGGNLILDGHGVAIMTDVVFDPSQGGDPNLTMEQLRQYMHDYFHCHTVYVTKDMQHDGTGHIDMFCKLLDDRNLIVGQYAKPSDGYGDNYYILNEVADQLAGLTNGKGEKFIVHRIPMPPYSYGTSYTHTNALIINRKVLVPIYGRGTDEAALQVYRDLLPGYKICGFDCNRIISANGAIHCITKLVMADPLEILHTPLLKRASGGQVVSIDAQIYSLHPLKSVTICWRTTAKGPFTHTPMYSPDGRHYSGLVTLPAQGKLYYFLQVQNQQGMSARNPQAPAKLYSIVVDAQ